jgi:hypothetical protein
MQAMLEGVFQRFETSNRGRIYPENIFKKEVEKYKELMEEHKETQTKGAVTVLGGDLYVKFGASDEEILFGYEYFAANSADPRVRVNAFKEVIYMIGERIKENYL